jgi:hypothetical protein
MSIIIIKGLAILAMAIEGSTACYCFYRAYKAYKGE